MAKMDDELIASFVGEATEFLSDVENDFLAIEADGASVNMDRVNKVFRGVHSMKGSAGFMGLKVISSLSHEMENVLNLMRNHEIMPNSKIVDALLRSADMLRTLIGDIANSNQMDVSEYLALLKASLQEDTTLEVQVRLNRDIDIPLPSGGLAFVMVKEMELVSRQQRGSHIYVVELDLMADLQDKDRTPLEFLGCLYEIGELIDSYISTAGILGLDEKLPDEMSFMILLGSPKNQDELAAILEISPSQIHHIASPEQTRWSDNGHAETEIISSVESSAVAVSHPESALSQDPAPSPGSPVQTPPVHFEPSADSPSKATPSPSGGAEQTSLRVNVKVLDTLMKLAGELVLGRNQLVQVTGTQDLRGVASVATRIDQVTSELQEAIMQTRMQPIGTVFNKFPRIIRDLSGKLGKQCELTIVGSEVEMDKTIIEAVSDPLTHLIRNSVDHGIEIPDVRNSRGKNPTGTITLKAYHQAGKVNIAIIDDGAGIDAAKLKEKAVSKGIISAEQAREMSEREALRLIFHPGFSMAEKVTEVSGRGVGMDVVRTNVEKLGGQVDVDSIRGSGTTVSIKLPLTLAIIPSLIVRSGEQRYAIPQVNIRELVRIKSEELSERLQIIKNAEVLRLRGKVLPLVRLSAALACSKLSHTDQETSSHNKKSSAGEIGELSALTNPSKPLVKSEECVSVKAVNVVVVEAGHIQYGLIVDELFDNKEIVVKPLGRHLKSSKCMAGATILGDGKVAMILDVTGIASHAQLSLSGEEDLAVSHDNKQISNEETQTVLVFSNHPQEWFALPTNYITRIERIRPEQIDSVGGLEVLQYRGGSLPLLTLEHHIQAQPRELQKSLFVIVFRLADREVGLIAPELIDIRDVSAMIDTTMFRQIGVVGSVVMDHKTVRLIDVFAMASSAYPDWFIHSVLPNESKDRTKRILLAEDSNFFRQQVSAFLETEGYEVIAVADGQTAWDILQNPEQTFDLVLTDIEMPLMTGLELASQIRRSPSHSKIPIIALSSLASDEDIGRGKTVGINDYQIKLNREELLASVAAQIKQPAMVNEY